MAAVGVIATAALSLWTLLETRDTQEELQRQEQEVEGQVRLEQVRTEAYAGYIAGYRGLRDMFDQFLIDQRLTQQAPQGVTPQGSPQAPDLATLNTALDENDLRFAEAILVADAQGTQAAVTMHDRLEKLWTTVFDALVDGNWSDERFRPLLDQAWQAEASLINAARAARGLQAIEFR